MLFERKIVFFSTRDSIIVGVLAVCYSFLVDIWGWWRRRFFVFQFNIGRGGGRGQKVLEVFWLEGVAKFGVMIVVVQGIGQVEVRADLEIQLMGRVRQGVFFVYLEVGRKVGVFRIGGLLVFGGVCGYGGGGWFLYSRDIRRFRLFSFLFQFVVFLGREEGEEWEWVGWSVRDGEQGSGVCGFQYLFFLLFVCYFCFRFRSI